MKAWRYGLVATGILVLLYGAWHLITDVPANLRDIAIWMIAIVIIHDGVLSPLVVTIGWLVARAVSPRPRRYLQAALVTGGLITVIALPLIHREDTQPVSKSLLLQHYGLNLAILLGLVAVANLIGYGWAVARDRRDPTAVQPQ